MEGMVRERVPDAFHTLFQRHEKVDLGTEPSTQCIVTFSSPHVMVRLTKTGVTAVHFALKWFISPREIQH